MKIESARYRERVLDAINRESIPVTVEHVRTSTGFVNWESTKTILLELVFEGKIKGISGGNGWLFYRKDLPL